MRLLDLYCGAGGAADGYARAGFEIVGVDKRIQLNYPYTFYPGDAISFLLKYGGEFDVIHASPPCQGYSPHVTGDGTSIRALNQGKFEPKLIEDTRNAMPTDTPYIIENVVGALPYMDFPIVLCGVMFGLPIQRHRLFESNRLLVAPPHPDCRDVPAIYAKEHGIDLEDMSVTGKGKRAGISEVWKEIMGYPADRRISQRDITESIPPSYTEYLGKQLLPA